MGALISYRYIELFERALLVFLVAVSAGAFGFVDLMAFGAGFTKTSESLFSRLLWPAIYLAFLALFVVHFKELVSASLRSWVMLLWPLLAAASVLWSIDPNATANGALRLTFTVLIGIYIGARFGISTLMKVVFAVLVVAIGASIVSHLAALDFAVMENGMVRGIFHHKNSLGSRAALLLVTALVLFIAGWRRWLTGFGMAIAAAGILLSQSVTALLVALGACLAVPLFMALRQPGPGLAHRVVLIGWAASMVALVVVLSEIDPIRQSLDALDRDATMSGRSILWETALAHIAERPVLGVGYDAFWDAALDWRMFAVLEELGYVLHFHNTFLEIGAQLGWTGIAVAAFTVLAYFYVAAGALRRQGHIVMLWPALCGAMVVALSLAEHALFLQHNLFHILLVALFTALLRLPRRSTAPGPLQAARARAGPARHAPSPAFGASGAGDAYR